MSGAVVHWLVQRFSRRCGFDPRLWSGSPTFHIVGLLWGHSCLRLVSFGYNLHIIRHWIYFENLCSQYTLNIKVTSCNDVKLRPNSNLGDLSNCWQKCNAITLLDQWLFKVKILKKKLTRKRSHIGMKKNSECLFFSVYGWINEKVQEEFFYSNPLGILWAIDFFCGEPWKFECFHMDLNSRAV